ncbi:hypothetical protein QW060_07400 [Myroides ceti]|uniref:Uncharacterized protein n=1 Tax=Paenimyroides ceti TaxID=395087 RepID=A0ABT8CTK5_9FLAO|nr:hypothetical protein [Paenimyroides ceti]MDN3706958.1 hypothetical protein [Paenimyroides ceti]
MRMLISIIGILALSSCESSDTCHCEVYKKVFDDNGVVINLQYQGSRDGNCNSLTDRDDDNYEYDTISCD